MHIYISKISNKSHFLTDPKVIETLTKLQAMGFTNEGGWLSQLVEIKRGNIEQVLDVLLPVKK